MSYEIEYLRRRLVEWQERLSPQVHTGVRNAITRVLSIIDHELPKEPASKVWHDATTRAFEGRILWHSTYNDTWMVMFADQINWNVCDKWAYLDELLKL